MHQSLFFPILLALPLFFDDALIILMLAFLVFFIFFIMNFRQIKRLFINIWYNACSLHFFSEIIVKLCKFYFKKTFHFIYFYFISVRLSFSLCSSEVLLFSEFMGIVLIFKLNSVNYFIIPLEFVMLNTMNRKVAYSHSEDSQMNYRLVLMQVQQVVSEAIVLG